MVSIKRLKMKPILFTIAIFIVVAVECKKPIVGLSREDMRNLKYDDQKFTCRDGEQTIPFSQVNDNYCDCGDSSDEPGTSACPNGFFFCTNKGHVGWKIFSSQVQDGVCDCCDGSDELGKKECPNTCAELSFEAKKSIREEYERQKEGLMKKKEYIQQAAEGLKQKRERKEQLNKELEELKKQREEQDNLKKEAERIEKEKRDQLEEKRRKEEEANRPPEEVAPPAENVENKPEEPKELPKISEEQVKEEEEEEEEEEEVEDEEEDKLEEEAQRESKEVQRASIEEDPELKLLIEASRVLRDKVSEFDNKIRDLERELSDIDSILSKDFGTQNEFYPLNGKCLAADTPEYTYELCPFDKANQKPKHGSSTSLGKWENQGENWTKDHKVMMYTGGLRCWGGPDRSMKVDIFCDKEDRVSDPSEPNKCEYALKMYTPAACSEEILKSLEVQLAETQDSHVHDEL